jgi:hypothetical protein
MDHQVTLQEMAEDQKPADLHSLRLCPAVTWLSNQVRQRNPNQTAAAILDINFLPLVEAKYSSQKRGIISHMSHCIGIQSYPFHMQVHCKPACLSQSMSISLHRRIEPGKHDTAMIEPIDN